MAYPGNIQPKKNIVIGGILTKHKYITTNWNDLINCEMYQRHGILYAQWFQRLV